MNNSEPVKRALPPEVDENGEVTIDVFALTQGYIVLESGRVLEIVRYLDEHGEEIVDPDDAVAVEAGAEDWGYITIEVPDEPPMTLH